MTTLHIFLIAVAAVFLILLPVSRRFAWGYARFMTLSLVAIVILMPFFWLICSAFKDKAVLNEYTFLPPIDKIDSSTINPGDIDYQVLQMQGGNMLWDWVTTV